MNGTIIDIERLSVSLHGVSSEIVEAAAIGLEEEVRRRLVTFPMGTQARVDLDDLAISPVVTETVLDASALRSIIADRLTEAIIQARPLGTDNGGGS